MFRLLPLTLSLVFLTATAPSIVSAQPAPGDSKAQRVRIPLLPLAPLAAPRRPWPQPFGSLEPRLWWDPAPTMDGDPTLFPTTFEEDLLVLLATEFDSGEFDAWVDTRSDTLFIQGDPAVTTRIEQFVSDLAQRVQPIRIEMLVAPMELASRVPAAELCAEDDVDYFSASIPNEIVGEVGHQSRERYHASFEIDQTGPQPTTQPQLEELTCGTWMSVRPRISPGGELRLIGVALDRDATFEELDFGSDWGSIQLPVVREHVLSIDRTVAANRFVRLGRLGDGVLFVRARATEPIPQFGWRVREPIESAPRFPEPWIPTPLVGLSLTPADPTFGNRPDDGDRPLALGSLLIERTAPHSPTDGVSVTVRVVALPRATAVELLGHSDDRGLLPATEAISRDLDRGTTLASLELTGDLERSLGARSGTIHTFVGDVETHSGCLTTIQAIDPTLSSAGSGLEVRAVATEATAGDVVVRVRGAYAKLLRLNDRAIDLPFLQPQFDVDGQPQSPIAMTKRVTVQTPKQTGFDFDTTRRIPWGRDLLEHVELRGDEAIVWITRIERSQR